MLLVDLVSSSQDVRRTRSRTAKIERLTACLRSLSPAEVSTGVAYLTGEIPGGPVQVGPALLREAFRGPAATESTLSVEAVQERLTEIAGLHGAGSKARRAEHLARLFSAATDAERELLGGLLMGELRQGAQEGVMIEAVARAADVPARAVRRAVMLCGSLSTVAVSALAEGAPGLRAISLELFRPVVPMLAHPAEGVGEALAALGRAALEYKLDGARVQVHKRGDDVRVFTRRLNDVSGAVPEIVAACLALPANEIVLDGEALALRDDGRPHPFQVTMRRFGRKLRVEEMVAELPLSVFFFDCLRVEGNDLLEAPGTARVQVLRDQLPEELCVPRTVTDDPEAAATFLEEALERGHEGMMAKSLDAPYEAGRRGKGWLKIKPVHTLDLVVLAAEWGSGRRQGWLSNLHLGARDPAGGFVMLGKTFKGMTDEMLAWQTKRLLELERERDGHTVHVRPELVVEVAVNELQASTHYPGGLALRFARLKAHRPDKQPGEADTIDTVRAIHMGENRERRS